MLVLCLSPDRSWDAVWEVHVSRDDEGCAGRVPHPFSQLRFSHPADGRIGFAVVRHVARLNDHHLAAAGQERQRIRLVRRDHGTDRYAAPEATRARPLHRLAAAHLKQTTVATAMRVNYTISPNLLLQLYGVVSAGHYEHCKGARGRRAKRYADGYSEIAYAGDADFNYLSFRTTNVLRWEFKPGSSLFVVWQQGREQDGERDGFSFGRDFRDAFATPSTSTLLVKFAYWLNL